MQIKPLGLAPSDVGGRRRRVVCVVGPTGAGKSALAVELAKHYDGEILSCDAVQVYRGLDIGTGKIGTRDRAGVPHHLLDVLDPDREFSAADYIRRAAPLVRDIDGRGKLPIVVGGTGLYLRALMRGLFDGPGRVPELRARISRMAERHGTPFLHRLLSRLDPAVSLRIHPNDLVRIARALEVIFVARQSMSSMMKRRRPPLEGHRFILVGLSRPRRLLMRRIERRVDKMFQDGLVDEVRTFIERYGPGVPAFKAIGYREVASYLAGDIMLAEAKQRTIQATVQYAKRQMTWFRGEKAVVWFDGWGDEPDVERSVRSHLDKALVKPCPVGEETLYAETAP